MGFLSRVESKMEDTVEGAASRMGGTPLSPVQIAKKAEKQMKREKMVGAGVQYAPTLYTVLVNAEDDQRLFGYYPTLAGETETYLSAKAAEQGFAMDGQPLVRFVVDDDLKRGKFEVFAEMVASPLVEQLRDEEFARYGIAPRPGAAARAQAAAAPAANMGAVRPAMAAQPKKAPEQSRQKPSRRGMQVPRGAAQPGAPVAGAAAGFGAMGAAAGGLGAGAGAMGYGAATGLASAPGLQKLNGQGVAGAGAAPQQAGYDAYDDYDTYDGGANEPASAGNLTAYLYDVTNDRAFTLSLPHLSIGREPGNDIVVPDINISRRHAELREQAPGTWILTDLGSTNGTFVNGRKIKSSPLRDADRVTLGATTFEFQLL